MILPGIAWNILKRGYKALDEKLKDLGAQVVFYQFFLLKATA